MSFMTIHLKRFRNFSWCHAWHHYRPGHQAHENKWEGSHTWSRPVPADTALEIKDRDKPLKATRLLAEWLLNQSMHPWMNGHCGCWECWKTIFNPLSYWNQNDLWNTSHLKETRNKAPPKSTDFTCVILTHVFQQRQSQMCFSYLMIHLFKWWVDWFFCCPAGRVIRRYREADFRLR